MNPRQLLFVNQHYHPDVAATGQHLTDLAEYLVGSGYGVEVWCSRSSYVEGQLDASEREVRNGVHVRRFRTPVFSRRTKVGRLTTYFVFYVQVACRLLLGRSRPYVVFLTTPPLLPFLGYLYREFRRQKYAIWSMDLHPEAEIASGMLEAGSTPSLVIHRLSDAGYVNATFVVELGRCMRERILARGVDAARLHRISIWIDTDEVQPVPHADNPLRPQLGIGEEKVITYAGNAGIAHRFEELCGAIEALSEDQAVRFIFVGDGPRRKQIEDYVRARRLRNFEYLDYFPRSQLRYSLGFPDIHIVTLRTAFSGVAVPAKLYGIMAAGRPVLFIGPTDCETADVIREVGCGAVVDPDHDPDCIESIAALLRRWALNADLRSEVGRRGRVAVVERYSRQTCCAEFEHVITRWWNGPLPS